MKIGATHSTALLCGLLVSTAAQAEDGWQYRVTPYLWLPTASVDAALRDSPPISSNTSILELLEFGFLATGEVRKRDWGILGEFNYLSLAQDASWGDHFDADVELKGAMGSAAVAYRFAKSAAGSADAFAGFRAWSLKTKVEFDRLPEVSKTKSWIDPIIGLRGRYLLTDKVFVSALGDIGGFGVGSHLQWEIIGSLGYQITDAISTEIGGRYLSVDFDDGSVDLNTKIRGPFVAVNFNF